MATVRQLLHLMTMLSLLTVAVTSEHYHIVPISSTHLCLKYPDGTCFILDELASRLDGHDSDELVIGFLPGDHSLSVRIKISDVSNVSLFQEPLSTRTPAITCDQSTGFEFKNITALTIDELDFLHCRQDQATGGTSGGAVFVSSVKFASLTHCSFVDNHALGAGIGGGAIHIEKTNGVLIERCIFQYNFAIGKNEEGGAISVLCDINNTTCKLSHNQFYGNQAYTGGAISLHRDKVEGYLFLEVFNTSFTRNIAINYGGAIYIIGGSVWILTSTFIGNSVGNNGGAVYLDGRVPSFAHNTFVSTNSLYALNDAGYGGAIYSFAFYVTTNSSHYVNNSANNGGAIYLDGVSISSIGNVYSNNTAFMSGGVLYSLMSLVAFSNDYFLDNTAENGAAIHHRLHNLPLEIHNSTFDGNTHTQGGSGVVYMRLAKLNFTGYVTFANNHGSLYSFNSPVTFHGKTVFTNNTGEFGGAITSIQSVITFFTDSVTTIIGNTANYGGGLSLTESTLLAYGAIKISNNRAVVSGGGMYAYQSTLQLTSENHYSQVQTTNITNNIAKQNGGDIYLTATELKMTDTFLRICNNTASNGGGMFLEQSSRVDLDKLQSEYNNEVHIIFTLCHNKASKGGAVYVSDSTNAGVLCNGLTVYTTTTFVQCFLQTIQFYNTAVIDINLVNTFFVKNTASESGGDVYGGLLDRCTINPYAEVLHIFPAPAVPTTGLEYLMATAWFDWKYTPNFTSDISKHISSDPVQVCFCLEYQVYCNYTQPTVSVKKGELFSVRVAAVDQVGSPVKATVISVFSSKKGIGRLKEGQEYQHIEDHCTDLKYNVYSMDNTAELQLYADGPCSNMGISKRNLNITFLPCICPIGFQRSPSQIDCGCVCDVRLRPYVSHCSPENETIQIDTNVWIEYINTTNNSGFIIQTCPYDYCVDKPVNISLNTSYELDKQCAYDRVGVLCGECEEGLSLVFASSRCKECSHYFLLLILPFALASIALVLLILLLNMTVATGTINGLIFYVNILAANRSIFLPFDSPNVLTVFISWLNLDLGIATCFYHGMNSYGKVLLQLVFPVYLFILIGIIIALCERSQRLSTLLGKKNPVATLCTLILLSYSKLIRTIISSLQLTVLDYPDGSREIVWLYDANVQYFSASHIPRFIAAFIIIILGGVYTTLLLFGQVFNLCSEFKFIKWVSHPKYDSFIKEHHAPLSDKHRYWVGLLLLARIIHFLISAFASEPIVILSVCTIAFGLVLLKLLNKTIYKNWLLDTLETSFLVNLVFLSLSTFYIRDGVVGGDQSTLANTSMAISFITFLGIVVYHSFAKLWVKAGVLYQRARDAINKRRPYKPAPDEDLDQEDLSDNDELPFEPETIQNYTDNNSDRPNTPPTYHTQPIIRRAVRDDQLREPALDDLIPVQPEDYIVSRPARPRRQQMTTYSEVDIGFDRENNSND